MKNTLITIFIITSLLFSSLVYADGGNKKFRLIGNLKQKSLKKITIKDIENLGMVEENVYNPYEKRVDLYGGVPFKTFVEKYAAKNVKSVTLMAIDDYAVVIPKSEWNSKRIILSTRMNKKYIAVRSKGPLRIVFPDYDIKKKEYETNLSHWIWMIKKIEFK